MTPKIYTKKQYEKLRQYTAKLEEYTEKISICGVIQNSYSKTDNSATFMRIKKDYMGNNQLLPTYNVQVGVANEYIAVVDINQYHSDMDCFIPLYIQLEIFLVSLGQSLYKYHNKKM